MMNGLSHVMFTVQNELSNSFKFKNSILNAITSLVLSSLIAYLFTHGTSVFLLISENINPYITKYYYKLIKLLWKYGEDESFKKVVNIKSITDNKTKNSLYNAVHWYLAHNNNIDFLKETPIDYSFEKDIDMDIKLNDIEFNKIEFDKIVANNKPITFTFRNKTINYVLLTKIIEVYGNEKKQKENYIISLETNILKNEKIDILDEFCHYCLEQYIKNLKMDEFKQKIFTNKNGRWESKDMNNNRKLEKVILKNNMNIEIKNDIITFINSQTFYNEMDHPYTRGYLLHGNPGTGKTSTIKGISNECKRHIHYLALNDIETDNELNELISSINFKETILVIEDIDAMTDIIHKKEEKEKKDLNNLNEISNKLENLGKKIDFFNVHSQSQKNDKSLTLSGLLNAIDGVFSYEGRILIMTTNHPEVLIESLIRPGRIDRKFKFTECNHDMIRKLFFNFFNKEIDEELLAKVEEDIYSPAYVTCIFMQYRNDPLEALKHLNIEEYQSIAS
jgi:chaperone BCS1